MKKEKKKTEDRFEHSDFMNRIKYYADVNIQEKVEYEEDLIRVQRNILLNELRNAYWRKITRSERPHYNSPDSKDATIVLLADIAIELKYGGKVKPIPLGLIRIILVLKPEIDIIWNAIKRKVKGVSGAPPNRETRMMDAALEYFKKNKDKFKVIKEAYLQDKKIYATQLTNPRRDFDEAIIEKFASEYSDTKFSKRILHDILKNGIPEDILINIRPK